MEQIKTQEHVAQYAKDCSRWEKWQLNYKYGALYIFPPKELRTNINSLRAKYDPKSQSICDAHISLTVPFPRAITQADWKQLQDELEKVPPLQIQCGPVHRFPGVPGVVLLVEPADTIRDIVGNLESGRVLKDAEQRKCRFTPHMTIAEFISLEETEKLFGELEDEIKSTSFTCSKLSYAVPDDSFHFTERKFLELAR